MHILFIWINSFLSCVRSGFVLFILLGLFACTSKQNLRNKENNTLYLSLPQPGSLHPIRSTDLYAYKIQQSVIESLLGRDIDTYKLEPWLAHSWKIHPNRLTYTFYLRKNIFWHDGKPLTADDVHFSLKAIQDISYGGARHISYYENISKSEVINSHTIRFYAKERKYGTFEKLATGLPVIPRHIYENKKTGLNKILVGSGPYQLKEYKRNKKIVLEKNKNWWGLKTALFKEQYHFDQIFYRLIQDTHDELIRMSQGQLDFLSLTSESYFKKTNKPPWNETVFKKQIENKSTKGYSFIGWNLTRPLFQNKNVRKALSLLLNRTLINEKFNNNANYLSAGPIYSASDYAPSDIQPVLFNPKKALELLNRQGWSDSDKNGVLDHHGDKKEFRFTLLFANKDTEKYLTIYQEDLKKYGIIMSLKMMEWTSFIKLIDEGQFDAVTLGWGAGSIEWYPKQIWHSASIKNQGSNFIGYNNPEVDRLIDRADKELDRSKRIQILRKVYKMIVEDHPYTFLFSPRYGFYAYSNRMEMEKPTYKYGVGVERYWKFQK